MYPPAFFCSFSFLRYSSFFFLFLPPKVLGEIFQTHDTTVPYAGYFPVSPDFASWLATHAERIADGTYQITEEGLQIFERTSSDVVTNGIRVEVRTVFVPALSQLKNKYRTPSNKYVP